MKFQILTHTNRRDVSIFLWFAVMLIAGHNYWGVETGLAEEILFQTESYRAELGGDAVWRSLVDQETSRSLLEADRSTSFAYLQLDGKSYTADSARRYGDQLVLGFSDVDTHLEYVIEQTDHWITFRLDCVLGTRPQRIAFLRIGVALTEHVGLHLNGTWDERTAVVVRGANRQTLCRSVVRSDSAELTASCQDEPGPPLEGSAASLLVVPTQELKTVMGLYAEEYGLPRNMTVEGLASKDSDMARGSYWFLNFSSSKKRTIQPCAVSCL